AWFNPSSAKESSKIPNIPAIFIALDPVVEHHGSCNSLISEGSTLARPQGQFNTKHNLYRAPRATVLVFTFRMPDRRGVLSPTIFSRGESPASPTFSPGRPESPRASCA